MAELLTRFRTRAITQWQLEDGIPRTRDPAVSAIAGAIWLFYDDVPERRVELTPEGDALIARCLHFLAAGEEYRWPRLFHDRDGVTRYTKPASSPGLFAFWRRAPRRDARELANLERWPFFEPPRSSAPSAEERA
jgi:hypothetical protein